MEIRETVKKLNLVNDINTKSLEELADEYLSSEDDYNKFVEEYFNIFSRKLLYQLRVSDHYDKILDFINFGSVMYPSEKNNGLVEYISKIIEHNKRNYRLQNRIDDESQAKYIFMETIGANKIKDYNSYDDVVSGMYNAALIYEGKGSLGLSDFKNYMNYLHHSTPQKNLNAAIDKYYNAHPLIKECKDINFLYFANYMIKTKPNEIDSTFIKDIEDVIETSNILYDSDMKSIENKEERATYKKMAKYTLKNIKKLEKERNLKIKKMKLLH